MKHSSKLLSFLVAQYSYQHAAVQVLLWKSKLSVTGINAPGLQPSKVVEQLFAETLAPYRINFCEADPNTKTCPDIDASPSATGVGGFFLPLAMKFRGLEIKKMQQNNGNALSFSAKLDTPVNKIQPFCGTVNGKVETRAPQRLHFKFQISIVTGS